MKKIAIFFLLALIACESTNAELEQINNLSYDYIVDQFGSGDFISINDALNSIKDDSKDNPVSIFIKNGIYNESVKLIERHISLIGEDRERCVVVTYTNEYLNPPLNIWCNSSVENMTFISEAIVPPESSSSAYGAHIDQNSLYHSRAIKGKDVSELEGTILLRNCHLVSRYANGVGAGTCPNTELQIIDCEIESLEKDPNGFKGGFRLHNYPWTGANQKALIKNCVIHNPWLTPPVILQDENHISGTADNFDSEFVFEDNYIYNEQGVSCSVSVTSPASSKHICGYILKGNSHGNSCNQLN